MNKQVIVKIGFGLGQTGNSAAYRRFISAIHKHTTYESGIGGALAYSYGWGKVWCITGDYVRCWRAYQEEIKRDHVKRERA